MSTSTSSTLHRSLAHFETFRESLIVIAIADGEVSAAHEDEVPDDDMDRPADLQSAMDDIREQFPKALVIQLLVFDFDPATAEGFSSDSMKVPPIDQSRSTTIKTVMCDISASFLAELATFAKSIQDLPSIESPGGNLNQAIPFVPRARPSSESVRSNSYSVQLSRSSSPARSLTNGEEGEVRNSSKRLETSGVNELSSVEGRPLPRVTGNLEARSIGPNDELRRVLSEPQNSSSILKSSGHDRKSAQPGSLTAAFERNRIQSRVRQTLIIGSLYMQVGRWPDAIRELVDGATKAKAFGDHLWHAKALENIVVTVLLQAWAGVDFQIPQICQPSAEMSRQRHTSMASIASSITGAFTGPPEEANRFKALQNLSALLPDTLSMILDVYGRVADSPGENLPQYSYCETVIRFAHLLALQHRCGGILNRKALQNIVLDVALRSAVDSTSQSFMSSPSKRIISTMLFRGYPSKWNSSLSLHEAVSVHAGIAAVLSLLGLQRKRAMVIKEMLGVLIPGLIQARKVGAAEVGIHPAAGLAALQSLDPDDMAGMGSEGTKGRFAGLLLALCRTYGIDVTVADLDGAQMNGHLSGTDSENEVDLLLQRIQEDSTLFSFGGPGLKTDILRLCANFSESLPDFRLVMAFTSALLKSTGSHSAAKSSPQRTHVGLSREEQARLASKFIKTLELVRPESAVKIETSYWDMFLVRGVHVADAPTARALVKHTRAEAKRFSRNRAASVAQGVGPFIHNALAKSTSSGPVDNVLVAGDYSEFIVLVQNVYDFDLIIEDISLKTEGLKLQSKRQPFIIGPRCLGEVRLGGTVDKLGEMRITGCRVKVQGCRLADFLIVSEPWRPALDVKIKGSGLLHPRSLKRRSTISTTEAMLIDETASHFINPKYEVLSVPVLEAQPLLAVVSTTLSQSMLAVLNGETRQFSMQLRNVAEHVDVDFLHVSFEIPPLTGTQPSEEHHTSPTEVYENEFETLHRQPFRWLGSEDENSGSIRAGATSTVQVEVLGQPSLSQTTVKVDYAQLGCRPDEVKGNLLTRQVLMPFVVTVNASIRVQSVKVMTLPSVMFVQNGPAGVGEENDFGEDENHDRSGFVLLLDLENEWTRPLSVSIRSVEELFPILESVSSTKEITETIQPGQLVRVALPMKKLYVEESHLPIPSLSSSTQRQFIYQAEEETEELQAELELFWYREELLKRVSGTWREVDSDRSGVIDMRVVRMDKDMLGIVRRDPVSVAVELVEGNKESRKMRQSKTTPFNVEANELVTLKATIRNDSSRKIHPFVRFEPVLAGQSLARDDLTQLISWTGLLNRPMKTLEAGERATAVLSFFLLSAGLYEMKIFVNSLPLNGQVEAKSQRDNGPAAAVPLLGTAKCTIFAADE